MLCRLRQFAGENGTLDDPRLLSPQKLGDCCSRHSIFREHRINDTPLIEGGQGATRSIGKQQTTFVFRSRAGRFDHDRYFLTLFLHPGGKALESIEDLERSIVVCHDTKRKWFEIPVLVDAKITGSKSTIARSQTVHRQILNRF